MDVEKKHEFWKMNVRSLFWLGALKVLLNELTKLDFDIIAL